MGELNEEGVPKALFDLKHLLLTQQSGQLSLSHLAGFSDEELEAAYCMACQRLNVGDIDDAAKVFAMICLLKHGEGKYWRGFAICNHRRKQYGLASMFYSIALRCDPDDVISRAFHAETLLWLNGRVKARAEAERAIEDGKRLQKHEHVPYLRRAEAVLSSLAADDNSGEFERR